MGLFSKVASNAVNSRTLRNTRSSRKMPMMVAKDSTSFLGKASFTTKTAISLPILTTFLFGIRTLARHLNADKTSRNFWDSIKKEGGAWGDAITNGFKKLFGPGTARYTVSEQLQRSETTINSTTAKLLEHQKEISDFDAKITSTVTALETAKQDLTKVNNDSARTAKILKEAEKAKTTAQETLDKKKGDGTLQSDLQTKTKKYGQAKATHDEAVQKAQETIDKQTATLKDLQSKKAQAEASEKLLKKTLQTATADKQLAEATKAEEDAAKSTKK
jgi:hypothetical protein